jgi:anti-sigma B factor antagonist
MSSTTTRSQDAFTIERRGDMMIVIANPAIETVGEGLEDLAARLILEPLKGVDEPVVLFDLEQVKYFGSVFLAVMIRCWKLVLAKSGTMALAGVSSHARELLHVTSLDTAWPIYADRQEAVESLMAD